MTEGETLESNGGNPPWVGDGMCDSCSESEGPRVSVVPRTKVRVRRTVWVRSWETHNGSEDLFVQEDDSESPRGPLGSGTGVGTSSLSLHGGHSRPSERVLGVTRSVSPWSRRTPRTSESPAGSRCRVRSVGLVGSPFGVSSAARSFPSYGRLKTVNWVTKLYCL